MKTILVIEDTPEMRENIAEILALAPYRVVQAANGKAGIELARQTSPDLILCDIMMPELDGFGVLHILSKDPELAHVPFIFLTAKADPADFRVGMNLGADDYLTKPFDDLALLTAVALRLKKGEQPPEPVAGSTGLPSLMRAIMNQDDAHQSLCDNYPTMHYRKKQILFRPGELPTTLYFFVQGKGKLFKTDVAGNEYITALLGAGDFVGYLALLEEAPYTETAELLDDAQVCSVPKADFMTLIYHRQEVANQFIRMLAGDVAELQDRMLKLAYQSVRKRVAEALLMYQRKFYSKPEGQTWPGMPDRASPGRSGDALATATERPGHASGSGSAAGAEGGPLNTSPAMTLSRENWSHLVGASTETIIRILGDFRDERLIDIQASQIILLDIDKLTRLKR